MACNLKWHSVPYKFCGWGRGEVNQRKLPQERLINVNCPMCVPSVNMRVICDSSLRPRLMRWQGVKYRSMR